MDSYHVTSHVTNHVILSRDIDSVYSEVETKSTLKMNGIMWNKTVECISINKSTREIP